MIPSYIRVYLMLEEIYAPLKLKNHCLWWIRQPYQILTISTDFNHLFPLNHLKFSLLAFSIIGDWFCVEYYKKYSLHVHWQLCVPYLPANIVSFILSVFLYRMERKGTISKELRFRSQVGMVCMLNCGSGIKVRERFVPHVMSSVRSKHF